MDLGFLSGLLGEQGKNNSAISMLLPLLFGGKTPFLDQNGGIGNLLGALKGKETASESVFPPLFGNEKTNAKGQNELVDIIGNFLKPNSANGTKKTADKYPYELQYNRPQ